MLRAGGRGTVTSSSTGDILDATGPAPQPGPFAAVDLRCGSHAGAGVLHHRTGPGSGRSVDQTAVDEPGGIEDASRFGLVHQVEGDHGLEDPDALFGCVL